MQKNALCQCKKQSFQCSSDSPTFLVFFAAFLKLQKEFVEFWGRTEFQNFWFFSTFRASNRIAEGIVRRNFFNSWRRLLFAKKQLWMAFRALKRWKESAWAPSPPTEEEGGAAKSGDSPRGALRAVSKVSTQIWAFLKKLAFEESSSRSTTLHAKHLSIYLLSSSWKCALFLPRSEFRASGWVSENFFCDEKNYVRHEHPRFQVQAFRIEFWEKSGLGMHLIWHVDGKIEVSANLGVFEKFVIWRVVFLFGHTLCETLVFIYILLFFQEANFVRRWVSEIFFVVKKIMFGTNTRFQV